MHEETQRNGKSHFLAGVYAMTFCILACQPVLAIGWREALFIFILIAIFVGPPIYKFIRRFENYQRHKDK